MEIRHMGNGAFLVRGVAHTLSAGQVYSRVERAMREKYPQGSTDSRRYARFIAQKTAGVMNGFRRSAVVTVK